MTCDVVRRLYSTVGEELRRVREMMQRSSRSAMNQTLFAWPVAGTHEHCRRRKPSVLLRSLLRRAAYEGLRPVPRDNWAAPLFEMPKAKKAPTVSSGIRKSTRTRTAPQRLSPDSDLPCVQPSAGRARSSSLSCRLCSLSAPLVAIHLTPSRPAPQIRHPGYDPRGRHCHRCEE